MNRISDEIDKLMVIVQNTNPVSEAAQRQRGIVLQAIDIHVEEECNKIVDHYQGNR